VAELEDIVGLTFEKLAPELAKIARRLFEIEGHVNQGLLTLESFLVLKHEIALVRLAIEDLPLLAADTKALAGGDVGAGVAS